VTPGAKVTAINQATGVGRDTLTGASGFYRISGLTPGDYTIAVEATSFGKKSIPDVTIAAEAQRALDVTLAPASEQQTVTVTATSEGLQTDTASITTTITSRQVVNLPEFGRDP